MLVETFDYFPWLASGCQALANVPGPEIEPDDLEAVVHARHEKVVFACGRRVPLHPPCAASDIYLCQRYKRLASVEEADSVVVAANSEDVLDVWMALDGRHSCIESVSRMSRNLTTSIARVVHGPFVDEERSRASLSDIPTLHLEIISTCKRR